MTNISVHYEIFIFDLSKVFKTMNIHFKSADTFKMPSATNFMSGFKSDISV